MNLIAITQELSTSQLVQTSEVLKNVCKAVISIYPEGIPVLPWAGYLAEEKGVFVGTCAYKFPLASGEVEIAYFTFPEYEGKGVATRMARNLVDLAIQNGAVRIRAQTLPEKSASTRILEKLGFTFIGTVDHPEDGEVWEWHR